MICSWKADVPTRPNFELKIYDTEMNHAVVAKEYRGLSTRF